jgi:bifunctional non-homologous end joining protein LigD
MSQTIALAGRELALSNLGKVLYPSVGSTKAQVIDYYVRVAPALLPHLRGRPLTLKRYPDGVDAGWFYEKRCPAHRPRWVKTAAVWSERKHEAVRHCLVDDLPTLVWAANLADLELHASLARVPKIDQPTALVLDLDPGPPADLAHCCAIAVRLRHLLDENGLRAWAKTSGGKGLQLYVPLNRAVTYERTSAFARALAQRLEADDPRRVVSKMTRALRRGKVLVDWSQNARHKTTVCVYSLRARELPTVSTPVGWDEVEEVARTRDARGLYFGPEEVLARVTRFGDLFAPVLKRKQRLP